MRPASNEVTDNEIDVRSIVPAKRYPRLRRDSVPMPEGEELFSRPHNTLSHLQCFLTGVGPRSPLQRRWEYRWTAASGACVAVILALLLGGLDWRAAVMAAAAAFMIARGGDTLDAFDERVVARRDGQNES
jgi:hypothetical protein